MNDPEASSPALGFHRRFKASEFNEAENPAKDYRDHLIRFKEAIG
jgi:hypothetical protein